jgi:hypothetical protein
MSDGTPKKSLVLDSLHPLKKAQTLTHLLKGLSSDQKSPMQLVSKMVGEAIIQGGSFLPTHMGTGHPMEKRWR